MILPGAKEEGVKPVMVKKEEQKKVLHVFNPAGFGKAGNNAISIMLAQGHFKGDDKLDLELEYYKKLTAEIYKADIEAQDMIKGEYK